MPRIRHNRARNPPVSAIRHVASLGFSAQPLLEIVKNSTFLIYYDRFRSIYT